MAERLVSMSEIMRVAPWSLRALGHPFGVAERATRLVAWTQAALARGLDALRDGDAALRESCARPPSVRDGRRVFAGGRNLLELGPVAVDLATRDARVEGTADVCVRDAIGAVFVPALAEIAGRRGLDAVFLFRAAEGPAALEGERRAGWVAVRSIDGQARYSAGDPNEFRGGAAPRAAAREIFENAAPRLRILAGEAAAGVEGGSAMDYDARLARAYRRGLAVDEADLAHLYALERITWAPTSERSRKQAGY